MRKGRSGRRFAGLTLVDSLAAPLPAVAAPDRLERVAPPAPVRSSSTATVRSASTAIAHNSAAPWWCRFRQHRRASATAARRSAAAPMRQVIVNRPQSIIENELLPAYQNDPNIFERIGLEVKKGPDGHINVVQPPGAANALGRTKFPFPNKFQVYLHDTPEKRLFSYDKRAFSHGSMRVKFGEVMLSLAMSGRKPNSRELQSLFGQE